MSKTMRCLTINCSNNYHSSMNKHISLINMEKILEMTNHAYPSKCHPNDKYGKGEW